MNRSAILGTVLLFLIFSMGCKSDPSQTDINFSVEDEFNILPWENLQEDSREFIFKIETIESQSCENTLIDLFPSSETNIIALTIQNIPQPDCTSPNFPAAVEHSAGELANKIYNIRISLKDAIHNPGILKVNEIFYEIKMDALNGIKVPNTRLYKIPNNSIWGYVGFEETTSDIANQFIDDINNLASDLTYTEGYYGYFSIENNEMTILNKEITSTSNRAFGYAFEGDTSQLMDILSDYRTQYPAMEFSIFTSKGEEL